MKTKLLVRALGIVMCVAMVLSPIECYAKDVLYSKKSNNTVDISSMLDKIEKITFEDDYFSIHIVGEDDSVVFDYDTNLTFEDENDAIESVVVADDIDIRYNSVSQQLVISSDALIQTVQLYSMQGEFVLGICPHSNMVNLSIAECLKGIYLIRIATPTTNVTKKILKR